MILVTIYTNLGAEGVIYGINQTQSHYVCTSQELLPKLIKVLDKVKSLGFAFSCSLGKCFFFAAYPCSHYRCYWRTLERWHWTSRLQIRRQSVFVHLESFIYQWPRKSQCHCYSSNAWWHCNSHVHFRYDIIDYRIIVKKMFKKFVKSKGDLRFLATM